jgi:hypothetical protein
MRLSPRSRQNIPACSCPGEQRWNAGARTIARYRRKGDTCRESRVLVRTTTDRLLDSAPSGLSNRAQVEDSNAAQPGPLLLRRILEAGRGVGWARTGRATRTEPVPQTGNKRHFLPELLGTAQSIHPFMIRSSGSARPEYAARTERAGEQMSTRVDGSITTGLQTGGCGDRLSCSPPAAVSRLPGTHQKPSSVRCGAWRPTAVRLTFFLKSVWLAVIVSARQEQ